MKRADINRATLLLRAAVLAFVLFLMLIQADSMSVFLMTIAVTAVYAVSNTLLLLRPLPGRKIRLMLLLLELAAAAALLPLVPYAPYFVVFIVLIVTAVTMLDPLPDQLATAGLSAAVPVVHRLYHDLFTWQLVFSYGLMIAFFISFSFFYRRFEAQQEELEQMNEALQAYADREKTWALEQERNRIARDLHDTVAHQSTGLIIQLQKLKYAYNLGHNAEVEASLYESEQAARTMLHDMRQSVRMIAPVGTSGTPFEQLFEDFTHLADMTISHTGVSSFYDLPFLQQADLYRLLQESLTNARRHGGAEHVSITVEREENLLSLRISDDGSGMPKQWQKGFGLRQMEERVLSAGGSLTVENNSGVTLWIKWPVPEKGVYV
jgi:signal transduction histidine kinase